MATIVDYNTLVTSVADFTHRSDLTTFVDYFIQAAQELINNDIFERNEGNGIQLMEVGYPTTAISNGSVPVPADWLAPKLMTISVGPYTSDLIFKSASWIYDRYPQRTAQGLPAYIARDTSASGSFPVTSSQLTFTTTAGQTVFSLGAAPSGLPVLFVSLDGSMLVPTVDYTGGIGGSTLTLVNGALAGQTLFAQFPPTQTLSASSTSAFIFGPYPDSAYNVQGTYYQLAPLLSVAAPTNWMVLNAPHMLHAAVMKQAAKFIKDPEMLQTWEAIYQDRIGKLVDRDKSERWGSATMQIELG